MSVVGNQQNSRASPIYFGHLPILFSSSFHTSSQLHGSICLTCVHPSVMSSREASVGMKFSSCSAHMLLSSHAALAVLNKSCYMGAGVDGCLLCYLLVRPNTLIPILPCSASLTFSSVLIMASSMFLLVLSLAKRRGFWNLYFKDTMGIPCWSSG